MRHALTKLGAVDNKQVAPTASTSRPESSDERPGGGSVGKPGPSPLTAAKRGLAAVMVDALVAAASTAAAWDEADPRVTGHAMGGMANVRSVGAFDDGTGRRSGRKRPRLRSRNSVIDQWLDKERGTDTYADLEDFIADDLE